MILSAVALTTAYGVPPVPAQPAPLTVDQVVQKLQANLDAYDKSIPSFMADEYIDSYKHEFSARGASATGNVETIAQSVFRLKKEIDHATNTFSFSESRDVSIIDGRPAKGRQINAPSMVIGAFSGGLAFVAEDQRTCRTYTLEKPKAGKPLVVRFKSADHIPDPEICILNESSSGRVWINPASMQIERMELDVPRHLFTTLRDDGRPGVPTIGHWNVEVTYKPVILNARTFWLPATILSTCSNEQTEWSYSASYRNYHLLEVHSRIVPPGE